MLVSKSLQSWTYLLFGGSYNFSSLLEFSSSPSDGVAQHFPYLKYIFSLEDSILEVSMILKLLYN